MFNWRLTYRLGLPMLLLALFCALSAYSLRRVPYDVRGLNRLSGEVTAPRPAKKSRPAELSGQELRARLVELHYAGAGQ